MQYSKYKTRKVQTPDYNKWILLIYHNHHQYTVSHPHFHIMTKISDYVTPLSTALLVLVMSSSMMFTYGFIMRRQQPNTGTKGESKQRTTGSVFPFRSGKVENDGMPQLPTDVIQYSQVPKEGKVFTATTIPKGLLKEHTTRAGTWGVINVSKGKLEYKITSDPNHPLVFELSPDDNHGIIEPQRLHQVRALSDDVEFVVEFHRLPGSGPVDEKREGL
jgi:tellurite resistance-related uncharacterized protein